MLPNEIMQSDILDILFENRNKTYGAYPLRKYYNKRLAFALTATLFVAAVFSILQASYRGTDHMYATTITIDDPHFINLPPIQPLPQPPLAAPQSPVHFRQTNNSTPVIARDDQLATLPTIDELTNSMIGKEISAGEVPPGDVVVSPSIGGEVQSATVPVAGSAENNDPLLTAEIMPEFPGGIDALRKFLLKNIRQPGDLQAGEKIVVLASFVVAKNGSIEGVKIIQGGRAVFDKEVLRVISKMPVWKPGTQNGHEVSVYFNLPVTFLGADGD